MRPHGRVLVLQYEHVCRELNFTSLYPTPPYYTVERGLAFKAVLE